MVNSEVFSRDLIQQDLSLTNPNRNTHRPPPPVFQSGQTAGVRPAQQKVLWEMCKGLGNFYLFGRYNKHIQYHLNMHNLNTYPFSSMIFSHWKWSFCQFSMDGLGCHLTAQVLADEVAEAQQHVVELQQMMEASGSTTEPETLTGHRWKQIATNLSMLLGLVAENSKCQNLRVANRKYRKCCVKIGKCFKNV